MVTEYLSYMGQNIVENSTFPRWWGWVLIGGWIWVVVRAFRRYGLLAGIFPAIGGLIVWSFIHFAISIAAGLFLVAGVRLEEKHHREQMSSEVVTPENTKSNEEFFRDLIQDLNESGQSTIYVPEAPAQ